MKRIEKSASARLPGMLRCKVSEKGCLSVYGLNSKWPVSLYSEQWQRLSEFMPQVMEFVQQNAEKLSRKGAA